MTQLPNILLVVLDTLRADHLSLYGYPRPTAPFLEELAAQGTVYTNAISPGVWTLPAHASLFTGTYATTHRTQHDNTVLPQHLLTLAEVLAQAGYRTCGVSNNAWVSSLTGLSRGFQDFYLGGRILEPAEHGGRFVRQSWWSYPAYVINKSYRQLFKLRYGDGGPWITQTAMRWAERNAGSEPFFLFLNYKEPHLYYTPPGQYSRAFLNDKELARARRVNQDAFAFMAGKTAMHEDDFQVLRGLYDGEIRHLDDCLRQLFDYLQAHRHLDNSLVLLVSDHGENIGDHGLMDHQYCVYDTLARIPFIAIRRADIAAGVRNDRAVQLHDVYPTVLDVVGLNGAARAQNQAQSLLEADARSFTVVEYLSSAHQIIERRFPDVDVAPFRRTFRALRTDRYKFIQASDGQHELYDLSHDPNEHTNLIGQQPELAQELESRLNAWVSQQGEVHPEEAVDSIFDKDIEDRLRGLGYL